MKRSSLLLIALFAALLVGCYRYVPETPPGDKLEIVDAEVVLGGGEPNTQTVSYRIDVQNNGDLAAQIEWVRPYLEENVRELLAEGQDLTLKVSQSVPPGETLSLEGSFRLNTKGKKKAAIAALQPLVTRFTVVTRQSLLMPDIEEPDKAEAAAEE